MLKWNMGLYFDRYLYFWFPLRHLKNQLIRLHGERLLQSYYGCKMQPSINPMSMSFRCVNICWKSSKGVSNTNTRLVMGIQIKLLLHKWFMSSQQYSTIFIFYLLNQNSANNSKMDAIKINNMFYRNNLGSKQRFHVEKGIQWRNQLLLNQQSRCFVKSATSSELSQLKSTTGAYC